MKGKRIVKSFLLLLVLVICSSAIAADPVYQAAPPSGVYIASGVADVSGPGGKAYVEYWTWDGGNDWYYYTYQIHNTDPCTPFLPYIKHLTIFNPSGEPYIITGKSGGYGFDTSTNQPTDIPGGQWAGSNHVVLPTLVDWVASDLSFVFAGQSSWDDVKFQFVSKLPPSMAGLTVRQGDLSIYASGLIASPGLANMCPRSSGYWKQQFGTKGKRVEAASLPDYLQTIGGNSQVFAGLTRFSTDAGLSLLSPDDNSDMLSKAKKQLFAVWLNVVSGKLNYAADVTVIDPLGQEITISIQQVVQNTENTILNASATPEQLEYAKDLAEMMNLL